MHIYLFNIMLYTLLHFTFKIKNPNIVMSQIVCRTNLKQSQSTETYLDSSQLMLAIVLFPFNNLVCAVYRQG